MKAFTKEMAKSAVRQGIPKFLKVLTAVVAIAEILKMALELYCDRHRHDDVDEEEEEEDE